MSEIKTKISTYNDVVDLFGEEKAADMLSEALDWSTIDPKNDKKNIMERKALLLDPYMTYENEDYCKHIVAGFLGDRDLDWASGYIDEEKIKNGQVMPADLKLALSMALDNELSTSWAYLDALSSQCAEIFNKFAGYIESAGLARGVLVPGEYELDSNALNADVSERFNIQYGFQCDQIYEQMEKELPRYGGTRFPPALAALSMDIIIPSSYICKMKAEINPKLSDREREHNSLNRTMHIKIADSRRNRLAQDRDKPRNINLRYDDDNHDSQ